MSKITYTDFQVEPEEQLSDDIGPHYHITAHCPVDGNRLIVSRHSYDDGSDHHRAQAKLLAEVTTNLLNEYTSGVQVPILDGDKRLYKEGNGKLHPRLKGERVVVANLIDHLDKAGFKLVSVHDGEETIKVKDMKTAMEHIFSVDESSFKVQKEGSPNRYSIVIVLGNSPEEVICDYSYPTGDPDGFNKAMDDFKPEKFL